MVELLPVLYQDSLLVAINKPAGLLVHKSLVDRHETRYAMKILRDQLCCWVYPIHRLDKPTSGVLLFALNAAVAKALCENWAENNTKRYLAVVRGWAPEATTVDHPLSEELDKISDRKARTDKPAQAAITHIRSLAKTEVNYSVDKYPTSRYSLVQCQPVTGRKHQIRRHLKHLSHPIIGDAKHGKGVHNRFFQNTFGCHRLLLHAQQLSFRHPITQITTNITAPMDETFRAILERFDWPLDLLSSTEESCRAAG